MLPREFWRRLRTCRERAAAREDAEWGRTLLVVNTVRGLVKAKPISLDDLKRKAVVADPANAPGRAAYLADLKRIREAEARAAAARTAKQKAT